MPQRHCCVPNCSSSLIEGAVLHAFPNPSTDLEKFQAWVTNAGLLGEDYSYVVKNRRICRIHFEAIHHYPKNRLSKSAIPTLYLPGKSKSSIKTTSSRENSLPLPDASIQTSDTTLPPSDTNPPPSDTHPPPKDTSLPPSDTNPPLSDTSLAPLDTCLPPSDTEDAIDYDDPQDFDSSEHNYTKKSTLLGTPQLPNPYEKNKPFKKPIIVVLSNTVISKTVTDESAASLSAPTSPSPELPVESSDRTLGGFKLGVSEQVLQFRLVNDGDCDEPIYKVLAEKESETRVETTASNTECNTVLQEEPSTTEDDDVKDKPEPQENVTKCERHKDKEYWKMKLTHILHETKFCGICLNAEDGMNALSDELEIVNSEIHYRKTLRQIVDCVFKKTDYPLANSQVCEGCTNKLIQSYMFIQSTEETAKVLNFHLNELYNKMCYIRNNDLKHKQAGSEIYNVVIALDKEIPIGFDCDITPEERRTAENKLNHPRAKRNLKCLSCNVLLPSHRAWRLHETTTHRNNHRCPICLQSFRTRQNFTAHYRMHLYTRCTICPRTVQDEKQLQHLKRRHRHFILLCSTCDIAFYSAETLSRHNSRCRHSAGPRCATRHRYKLACPSCGQKFPCRLDLASHVCESKQTRKRVHVCEYCDKQFSKEVTCQRHRKECGRIQRQYQCDYCPANCDSSRNLTEHRKRKHK